VATITAMGGTGSATKPSAETEWTVHNLVLGGVLIASVLFVCGLWGRWERVLKEIVPREFLSLNAA
jgi:hypothetical protein